MPVVLDDCCLKEGGLTLCREVFGDGENLRNKFQTQARTWSADRLSNWDCVCVLGGLKKPKVKNSTGALSYPTAASNPNFQF